MLQEAHLGDLGASDLGHGRSTSSDATDTASTEARTAAARSQSREDGRGQEGGEAEPEKGGDSLRLLAPLGLVVRAGCDLVALEVVLSITSACRGRRRWGTADGVEAAVDLQLGGHGYSSDEEEKGVDDVHGQDDGRVHGKAVAKRGRDEVEEREHGKDGDEHVEVDQGRVAAERIVDDATDQSQDQECPQELRWSVQDRRATLALVPAAPVGQG